MKKSQWILKLAAFTSILWLAGCGQKGPLYLETNDDVQGRESAAQPRGDQDS